MSPEVQHRPQIETHSSSVLEQPDAQETLSPQVVQLTSERIRASERPASPEQESVTERIKKAGQKVAKEHGETVARRHEAAQQGTHLDKKKATTMQAVGTIVTVIIESIPGSPLGPWGIGDVVTAIEGLAGHTLDGLKLSWVERGLYVLASAIPVVPGRLLVEGYRRWEESKRKDIHEMVRNPQTPQN